MRRSKLLASAVIGLAFGAAGAAFAGSPAEYFEKIDANADGTISQAEFVAHKTADGKYTAEKASEKFSAIAGDDGQITLAEMEGAMKASKRKKKDCKDKDQTTT